MLSVSTRFPAGGIGDALAAEAGLAGVGRLVAGGMRIFDLEFEAIFCIPVGFPDALAHHYSNPAGVR